MSATTNRISAAFFDVDGTVTTRTTIFGFLAFYLSHRGDGPEAARAVVDQLHWLRAQGHSRESVNRAYYRTYAGERRDRLESLGRQWFACESRSGDFFVPEVKSEIDGYRRVGIPIVLVSGSFFACLDPLAEHLGADEVHGSPLVIEDGVLTGELETPLIGESKVDVLAKVTAAHGWDPRDCAAYGDHSSDIPMLTAVGHPVAVGAALRTTAWARGWPILAAGPGQDQPPPAHYGHW